MWSNIDPHLLLFSFLPALLFADSMGLNWRLWKRCLPQCLLLAGPGVLIGTVLTACVGFYIFPYGWSWREAAMFGSILSATDPVAVVSILKELGAPDQLTMCVSGESLLNDGTAIVLFNMFLALALSDVHNGDESINLEEIGADPKSGITPGVVVRYFCWMSVGGIALGTFSGLVAVYWLAHAKRKTGHEDAIIQIAITLCLAYLTFFHCRVFGRCEWRTGNGWCCSNDCLSGLVSLCLAREHGEHLALHRIRRQHADIFPRGRDSRW
jgi:NhaP-type Na+/H+ or K+/H+ antiporter